MVAITVVKFLIVLNKDTHIFILQWESPNDATDPIQDTLQFYKHCVYRHAAHSGVLTYNLVAKSFWSEKVLSSLAFLPVQAPFLAQTLLLSTCHCANENPEACSQSYTYNK